MTGLRTLPIRVAPAPGEALDSWLEALAARLATPLGDVLRALGLPAQARDEERARGLPADWTIVLSREEAGAVAYVTGTRADQLGRMTLAHYDQRALRLDVAKREVNRRALWGRGSGSRFCAACLAESGGRWMLTWRLGWSFACLAHCRLLADACPCCGRVQRRRPYSGNRVPQPGHCSTPPPRRKGHAFPGGCDFDLTQARSPVLPADHPVLRAQRRLLAVIESGTADFGAYRAHPQPAPAALTDIRALAGRVLADVASDDLSSLAPGDVVDAHLALRRDQARAQGRPGFMAPPHAASTAVAAVAALGILEHDTVQHAAHAMRALIQMIREKQWQVSATSIDSWGRGISPVLKAVHLAALGPSMRPGEQLRHRTVSALPTRPAGETARSSRRARKIPGSLWPAWAVRLSPPGGAYPQTLAPVLSGMLLLVGARIELAQAADLLGSATDGPTLSRIMQLLRDDPHWTAIHTGLDQLAEYLDAHDVPIDYRRRRALDYAGLLPTGQWRELCRSISMPPGLGRRRQVAQCLLFQRISGLPYAAMPDAAVKPADFKAQVARFAIVRTPELAAALDDAARDFLARQKVRGEPVAWQPPIDLLDGLDFPGPDPERIDIPHLHRLVRAAGRPQRSAAQILGTTADAVQFALEEHPAPAAALTASQSRATGRIRHEVRSLLPADEFSRLYRDQRQSLRQIARLVGCSRQTLARLAGEYGIVLREGPQDYKRRGTVGREWLYEQYVIRCRTLPDLAREKGMSTSNMARWARTHDIPLRARGGASHAAALVRLSAEV
ncbi:TniQ family protein [Actinocrinis puniceicyclus]|uniref:TniQ family protein n=1 Tax=Actinocrinis puniceicyclus TaxID=977794 RepID=A0A8J7WQV7_9ACTN|nr:TniQ family protein [Actinocrinis puniceicyclus]MBS2964767.1 TniQ family protein [Actinocrinis puniceicyclus]